VDSATDTTFTGAETDTRAAAGYPGDRKRTGEIDPGFKRARNGTPVRYS